MHKKIMAVIVIFAIVAVSVGGVIATQKMQPKTDPALNMLQPYTVPTVNNSVASTPKVKNPLTAQKVKNLEKQVTGTAKKAYTTTKQDTTIKQDTTKNQDANKNKNITKMQNSPNVNVSPAEAKAVAQSVIAEPSMLAGTPKLVSEAGSYTYYVPVISNGKAVGEIFIDAQTGKCIGGTA